jgi:hypothetical protein
MNLSAWIDLAGVFVELPLMIPLTPEGWTLPSLLSMCICAANIMPAIVIFCVGIKENDFLRFLIFI